MADCGASGSALDRTTQAVWNAALGSSNNNSSGLGSQRATSAAVQHMATLLGQKGATSSSATLSGTAMIRPAALPDRIDLSVGPTSTIAPYHHQSEASQPPLATALGHAVLPSPEVGFSAGYHRAPHDQFLPRHSPNTTPDYRHMMMMMRNDGPHLVDPQRQQMAAAAAVQQQWMTMMHQQQQLYHMKTFQEQILRHHQQQQHHEQVGREEHRSSPDRLDHLSPFDTWHEGLDTEALRQHLEELHDRDNRDVAKVGAHYDEEGIAQGATMEDLAAAWAEAAEDFRHLQDGMGGTNHWWEEEFHQQGQQQPDGVPAVYEFVNKDLPEVADPQQDWMQEGLRQFQAGNLKEAIRAFEMELQLVNPDNASAWRMLGRCHAENDMDREAIACLEQAVERDPYSPESLLALGVSYVNELNHGRALESLKAWITHNPKYVGMELDQDLYGSVEHDTEHDESSFDEVQRLLLRAMEFDPSEAADVLEALGVVYNVSRDYDAAANSFRRALELRPDDYQLWNKLGATLANGNQSEKALPAYYKALQIKPKYARSWLNMAISHSNLKNYHEAARCYLQTLSLNPSATHCWSYLRVALSCAERWDLIQYAASQDLTAFREHFDFVMYETSARATPGV